MSDQQDLARRLAEYETLLEIGRELASTLDLQRVLETALRLAEEVVRAETSSIWELDEERHELFFRIVRGRAASDIRGLRVPLGQGIVGSVALSGVAEAVNDVAADPRWRGDTQAEFQTRAILAVPLVARAGVIGVLQLRNPVGKSGFSPDDERRMSLFAGPLATAIENARLFAELQRQFLETVTALAEAVEKRDPYTGGHVHRVVCYSLLLGREMGLGQDELEELRLSATLHDIGKIGVPDRILNKPAPLDPEEQQIMRRHTVDGAEIVSRIRELRSILPGVRSHHERVDGRGYPDGLVDPDIPRLARIIAVADTYDAITTSRPYRAGMQPDAAAGEIRREVGQHFCPLVVEAFERLYERQEFTLARGHDLLRSLSLAVNHV